MAGIPQTKEKLNTTLELFAIYYTKKELKIGV
jgi:hypothetical protein